MPPVSQSEGLLSFQDLAESQRHRWRSLHYNQGDIFLPLSCIFPTFSAFPPRCHVHPQPILLVDWLSKAKVIIRAAALIITSATDEWWNNELALTLLHTPPVEALFPRNPVLSTQGGGAKKWRRLSVYQEEKLIVLSWWHCFGGKSVFDLQKDEAECFSFTEEVESHSSIWPPASQRHTSCYYDMSPFKGSGWQSVITHLLHLGQGFSINTTETNPLIPPSLSETSSIISSWTFWDYFLWPFLTSTQLCWYGKMRMSCTSSHCGSWNEIQWLLVPWGDTM